MTFTQMDYPLRMILVSAATLTMVINHFLLMTLLVDRKWKRFYLIVVFMAVGSLAEMIYLYHCTRKIHDGLLPYAPDFLPFFVHVLIVLIFASTGIFLLVREYRTMKHQFRNATVREAIDQIPTGLCFADMQGNPVLTNRKMYEIAEQLIGRRFRNANRFWEQIKEHTRLNGNVRMQTHANEKEETYIYKMEHGKVRLFSRSVILVNARMWTQIVVSDVTRQYELYQYTAQSNKHLAEQHREIRKLTDRMIRSNHEEEALRYKIDIHNRVGQMIQSTGRVLAKDNTKEAYHRNAEEWEELAKYFARTSESDVRSSKELLDEITEVAGQIGCEVVIGRPLPDKIIAMPLVRQVIREAIVNAVKHGRSNRVTIDYRISDGTACLWIRNNGTIPNRDFEMTGGLKNLSDGLRAIGGYLAAEAGVDFCLTVYLPYEEETQQ